MFLFWLKFLQEYVCNPKTFLIGAGVVGTGLVMKSYELANLGGVSVNTTNVTRSSDKKEHSKLLFE